MFAEKVLVDNEYSQLQSISGLIVKRQEPLRNHTRFALGGPATVFAETADPSAFVKALQLLQTSHSRHVVLGGGTNLIVSDKGYQGVVLRYIAAGIRHAGNRVQADAGAELNDLVDSLKSIPDCISMLAGILWIQSRRLNSCFRIAYMGPKHY